MKLAKRFFVGFLCMVLMLSVTACSKTDKSTESESSSKNPDVTKESAVTEESAETEELEPMEISVAIWGIQDAFDNANAATDTIFNDLSKKFNVTIKPVGVTWNDWQEKNKIWAASSTLPDVFCDSNATDNFGLYKTWAEQGVTKEIPSDLSAYPNLQKLFGLDSVKALALDGKYYMVPRGSDLTVSSTEASGMSRAVMYRKDWAAAAGYTEAPKTFDELVKMVNAMKAQHPGAVGIAMNSPDYMQALALDIYPEISNYASWVFENNQWKPSYASERTIPYIERLQKLYNDGILDPDFITQKDGDGLGKFQSGNACVMLGGQFDAQVFMESNKDVTKLEDALGFITPFAAQDGNTYVFSNTPFWSETYINAKADDDKTKRILMMLDYMYSHEYASLVQNGMEGVDWEKSDTGNVSLLKDTTVLDKYPITQSIGWLASWQTGFAQSPDMVVNSNPAIAAYNKLYNETYSYENDNCKVLPIDFGVMLMNNDKKSDITGLTGDFKTTLSNIIISKEEPKKAWDAMIKDFNTKGLQLAIEAVTKQAADEGIVQK